MRYGEEADAERIVEDVRTRIEEIVAGESWGEVQTLNGGVEERNRILSPEEAKERMKELSSRYKSRSAVMLDEDLPREEFIELLKAAGMPEADAEAIQSEDIKEFIAILKGVFATSPALYFPETGKIYIFADNIKAGKAETIFFHENLHGILHTLYGEGTREIADTYWQSAKDRKGRTKREIVENRYREEKRAEEYFVYHLAQSMADGDFRGIDEALPSEKHKAILNEIFNEIGYDREKEESYRASQTIQRDSAQNKGTSDGRTGGRRGGSVLGGGRFRGEGVEESEGGAVDAAAGETSKTSETAGAAERVAWAAREADRAEMRSAVQRMGEKLHTPVNIA